MRVRENIGDRIDRPGGHTLALERFQDVLAGHRDGQCGKDVDQNVAVADAVGVGAEPLVGGEAGLTENECEPRELAIVADRDDHVPVRDGKNLIGDDVRVGVAHPRRLFARGEVVHRLVREHAHLDVEQRHVEMSALPRLIPPPERSENADGGIHTREDVGVGDADLLGLAVRRAGDVHDAAHALDHEVVSRPGGVGSVLAETRDRAIDEAWIEGPQRGGVEAVFRKAPDLEILDDDIRMSGETANERLAFGGLEIDGDRALAAVAGMEIARRTRFSVGACDEGRPPAAGIVAALRALDLHHIGAEIRQELPHPGPGKDPGKLEDLQSRQRFRHDRPPPFSRLE